jgi:hypothetical protein
MLRRARIILGLTLAGALLSMGAGRVYGTAAAAFVLAAHGESPYAIVLADEASPSERHAAHELQHFVQLATGARLPLIDEGASQAHRPPRIFVGAGRLVAQLPGTALEREALGNEGFVLRTVGPATPPDLVIAGGRRRGTMYGVYTLLDRLGFRWYTNRKTWYPEGGVLQLEAMDEQGGPAFMYREPYIKEAFDADWAARNRVNSHSAQLGAAHGGKVGVLGVHTFNHLIPYSLYQEHPEYFPLIGGERVTGYVQRCLTNQEVVQVAAANLSVWMDKNPDDTFFSLSQEDTENLCECIPCARKMEEEESPMGLYLDFVNQVAEIVEQKHPDQYVSTLAYWFTEKPPKTVRPRHNVFIRLCPISICSSHPFTQCSEAPSRDFSQYLQEWAQITDRIIIWHYNTNFKNFPMPFPNFKEFTADVKTYHQNGVRGIFFQGSAHSPAGGDSDLRAWVMARLLWNPHQDAEALVNEWLHGVYGKAYPPMRAYYDLIHAQVEDADRHLHIFEAVTRELWSDEVVARMDRLHQEALELAAGDETALYYVRKNQLATKFLHYVLNTGRLEVADGVYQPVGNEVTSEDHDRLVDLLEEFGVGNIREESRDSDFRTMLRQRVERHAVITLENQDVRLEVVPELGGRIVELIHKDTGINLLHGLGPEDNFYPVWGGYGESTTWTWGGTGFANAYAAEVDGRKVKLAATARNGLRFERTIALPEQGAKVHFSSSITNVGNDTTTYRLVCRMNLKADLEQVALKARSADGTFAQPLASEEKKHTYRPVQTSRYDGPNKPSGAWRLENVAAGFTVENTFDEEQVEACWLVASKKAGWARMEVQSAEREVPPGGKIAIDHSWEIRR